MQVFLSKVRGGDSLRYGFVVENGSSSVNQNNPSTKHKLSRWLEKEYISRCILHKCKICGEVTLCDIFNIRNHLNLRHSKMKIPEYEQYNVSR